VLSLPTRPRAGLDSSRFRMCQNLLVDVERGHGYFDMAGFVLGVEDELGVMTQVASPRGLKLPIRDRVLREAVAL
jgi:predicted nucleotidyltransferase